MQLALALVFLLVSVWLLFLKRWGSGPKHYRKCEWHPEIPILYQKKILKAVGEFFLVDFVLKRAKFSIFRSMSMREEPTFVPIVPFSGDRAQPSDGDGVEKCSGLLRSTSKVSAFNGIADYVSVYSDHSTTPTEVADQVLAVLSKARSLNAVIQYNVNDIHQMAKESTLRYEDNNPLSPIDGVPILIKDEFAVTGYPYSCGTSFLGKTPETEDCEIVRKLRSLGALIVGVCNMQELGIGTTGNNPNKRFGATHNPYDIGCYSGGSSSGCASALVAGLCAAAIGTDGGGSIRIPSAYCGVVGLKPTFGRISLSGLRKVTYSVGHAGPICTSVKDAALLYALMAYADPKYSHSLYQPAVKLPDFTACNEKLNIGIYQEYFEDCDEDVKQVCKGALSVLESDGGCKIEQIKIPELEESRIAHLMIILAEMTDAIAYEYDHNMEDLTPESRLLFRAGRKISSTDLLQANKQRTRCMRFLKEIFEEVDVIITPSTGQTAPAIHPGDISAGSLDLERDLKSMRYVYLGNLCGIPCITLPVGYSVAGLPVGLQVMAPWWKEDIVLKAANYIESLLPNRKLPPVHYDILKKI